MCEEGDCEVVCGVVCCVSLGTFKAHLSGN